MMSEGHLKTFSKFWTLKKRFGRSRGSDVLDSLKAQRPIICPLAVLKNDFDELDRAMFQGVERPCELIFFIPVTEKTTLTKLLK
jgi:hypothetical protein